MITLRTALSALACVLAGCAMSLAAEREWQNGVWREERVERPKVLFGVQTRDPNSSVPRTVPTREIRTYVIETNSLRLELRQDAMADTPRIAAPIGQPVTFALENKTVYVKDEQGKEHKLSVRKQTRRRGV